MRKCPQLRAVGWALPTVSLITSDPPLDARGGRRLKVSAANLRLQKYKSGEGLL